MKGTSYFGYKCPRCSSTVDIGTTFEDEPKCPSCQTTMVPNPQGKVSAANVYCANCKIAVGLVNSDKCPQCGGSWSRLP